MPIDDADELAVRWKAGSVIASLTGQLLRQALNHRSWCRGTSGSKSNERLEFLGDAVLGWAVADLSYRRFEHTPEGQLTDLRKSVVNAVALADVAREIGLGNHVRLGRGEAAAEGPGEAVDPVRCLRGGARRGVSRRRSSGGTRRWSPGSSPPGSPTRSTDSTRLDNKTLLQERAARAGRGAPVYTFASTGPDHAKTFVVSVFVDDVLLGQGTGRSKKAAEQLAAAAACAVFD